MGQSAPTKTPPVLPKYGQHVAEPSASGDMGGEAPLWKSPPTNWVGDLGGKAAVRGAAAMGTKKKKKDLGERLWGLTSAAGIVGFSLAK